MTRSSFRRPLAALALLSPLLALAAFQALVVPTDLQLPGTQPLEIDPLMEPANCFFCHANYDPVAEPGRNWQGSMMAHATRDPLFWGAMAVAEQTVDGAGDLCLRCHTPAGWLGGRSTPTDGSALSAVTDADGVTCDACHRLTDPDTSEWLGVQNAPFLAHDETLTPTAYLGSGQMVVWEDQYTKLGPYSDAVPPHGFAQSKYHRSSELCGTCHDVSNPLVGDLAPGHGAMLPLALGTFSGVPGTPVAGKAAFNNPPAAYGVVERTFSEHQASSYATLPVSAYTGLPGELKWGALQESYAAALASNPSTNYLDGDVRLYSCQSCHMKPVNGAGCALGGSPVRSDLPSHDLTGGNYWAPEAIAWLNGMGKLVIGGSMDSQQLSSLAAGALRARHNLEQAAKLDLFGEFLRVTNLTGHKLISGYPEGRRMWLNTKWYGSGGGLLREDGAYGPISVVIDGTPTVVESLLDPADPYLHSFEAHHGMSQAWAAQLLGYGFPAGFPLGFDRVTGAVDATLGALAAQAPGTTWETFHFVLNDQVLADQRIPPYGFRYDDALARSALPVPDSQYGNPGPGGIFAHWAWIDLDPPAGAVNATIELLYQPTSWEYISFLHESNDGSVPSLAHVGEDLLDAWLATGMAAPHVMAGMSILLGQDPPAMLDVGFALPSPSVPFAQLDGTGPAVPGESVSVTLSGGPPNGSTTLVLGLNALYAPLKGGVLVPTPDIILPGLPLNDRGGLSFVFPWPTAPSGTTLFAQAWFADAQGVAASNGLSITTD